MNLKCSILDSQTLLETSRFQVRRVTHSLPNGESHSREIIQHPGAVVIIPVLDDGRICLIQNYRVAIDQVMLELPAGTLEPGEPPAHTAQRELAEETGYRCESLEPLCDFFMSPGILNEHMHAFVARGLSAGPSALEAGEQIENRVLSQAEIAARIRDGQVKDAKTMAALLFFFQAQ